MKYLYILKTGETFVPTQEKYGDFDAWVRKFLPKSLLHVKTIYILKNQKLPNLQSAAGFIITGAHAMVSEELAWSLQLEKYIKQIASKNIPLLGICYGHQLIAKALGGRSDFNTKGLEIGRAKIKRSSDSLDDPLLQGFTKQFYAFETHYQSAIKLPPKATILASNSQDRHQAVRFTKSVWGVQFHPEFDTNIMKEYIMHQKETLQSLNVHVDKLLENVQRCDLSNKILKNFVNIAEKHF